MTKYCIKGGWMLPASDVSGAPAMHATVGLLEGVYRHCAGFEVVVQAGGCVGIYPFALSERFNLVYTFEPDPVNFRCLCANVPSEKVFKFNAALGVAHELISLHRRPENIGAHHVEFGAGAIPTMRIDDLKLQVCNLIHLDIEGCESAALHGARETIERCRPVIVIEDKGESDRYGIQKGETPEWIARRFGYQVVDQILRDVVMAPC